MVQEMLFKEKVYGRSIAHLELSAQMSWKNPAAVTHWLLWIKKTKTSYILVYMFFVSWIYNNKLLQSIQNNFQLNWNLIPLYHKYENNIHVMKKKIFFNMVCKHYKSLHASPLLSPILNDNTLMLHAKKDDLFYMHLKKLF